MIVVKSCFPNYSYYYYYYYYRRYVCVCVCVSFGREKGKTKRKGFLKSERLEVLKKNNFCIVLFYLSVTF